MSCKSTKVAFHPDTTDKVFLTFGTGGGFTGKVLTYYLLEDGAIYIKNGDEIKKIGITSKRKSMQAFTNYENLGIGKININEPGNKYFFIEKNIGSIKNMIKWGKEPLENKNIETYFTILMNIVKEIKPSENL